MASLFAAEGAAVAVIDRDEQGGEETVRAIRQQGHEALFIEADVSREPDIERAVELAGVRLGRLDIVVNNAGIDFAGRATDTSAEEWDRVQSVNLRSVFLCCKHAIPDMRRQGGGAIVNIASANALVGVPERAAYSAAKAGVLGLTRQLALDYGPDNIRVNCICPTTTITPMALASASEEELQAFAERHPLRRICRPEDVAFACLFLASDEAACITGVILPVDAGWTAQ